MTTSQPLRWSTRAVAALVSGNMASATQPRNRATPCPLADRSGAAPRASARSAGRAGQHRLHPAERRRQELGQAARLGPVEHADFLEQPRRRERELDPAGVGKQVVEDQPLEQAGTLGRPVCRAARATLNGSISLPYCTPDGQADSQARQSRQRSRCSRTSAPSPRRPSATVRIR